jgi:hypothetical protein
MKNLKDFLGGRMSAFSCMAAKTAPAPIHTSRNMMQNRQTGPDHDK